MDREDEMKLMLVMRYKAYDAVGAYRKDPYYKRQFPTNVEALVDEILNIYQHI